MTLTAHWIDPQIENTVNGPRRILKLRSDLIGFQRVPGHHTGEHLAHALLYLTDRLGITEKVGRSLYGYLYIIDSSDFHQIGWITVDNASNTTPSVKI